MVSTPKEQGCSLPNCCQKLQNKGKQPSEALEKDLAIFYALFLGLFLVAALLGSYFNALWGVAFGVLGAGVLFFWIRKKSTQRKLYAKSHNNPQCF